MPTSASSPEAPRAYPYSLSTRSDLMRRLRRDVTFGHSHQCQVDFDSTTYCVFVRSILFSFLVYSRKHYPFLKPGPTIVRTVRRYSAPNH